tara:strand:+ start:1554 stop:1772 length:219 start_codon:yes stop_codon:yes gene_type:complete
LQLHEEAQPERRSKRVRIGLLTNEAKGVRCPARMKMIERGQKDFRAGLDPTNPARQIPWAGCLENEYLPSVC